PRDERSRRWRACRLYGWTEAAFEDARCGDELGRRDLGATGPLEKRTCRVAIAVEERADGGREDGDHQIVRLRGLVTRRASCAFEPRVRLHTVAHRGERRRGVGVDDGNTVLHPRLRETRQRGIEAGDRGRHLTALVSERPSSVEIERLLPRPPALAFAL